MVEPLIEWLKSLEKGYTLTSNNLTLSSKGYAYDAIVVASTIANLNTQIKVVNLFSEWSGTQINIPKHRIVGYIHALQLIKQKTQRDETLQSRLANVRVGNTLLSIISQDDTFSRGYLGTVLTASLCPKVHLKWTLDTLSKIIKAILSAPLSPGIQQRLLIYGANSKIMHTHCLMPLLPTAIASIDSA